MVDLSLPQKKLRAVRFLSTPVLILVFVVVLISVVIQIGYSRITAQLQELKSSEEKERVLQGNISVLRQVQAGVLEQSNICLFAFPEKNPSPFTLSLLKKFAEDKSTLIDKLKVQSIRKEPDGTTSIKITVTAITEEDVLAVKDFIQGFLKSVPISSVNAVEVNSVSREVSSEIEFELELSNYWASLPEQLPEIDKPISQLTAEENNLLEKISALERPEFTTLAPIPPSERETPFN